MLYHGMRKTLAQSIFPKAVVNGFGMMYTLTHRTSLLVKGYCWVTTTVYTFSRRMSCFSAIFQICSFIVKYMEGFFSLKRVTRNATGFSITRAWKKSVLLCKTEKMPFSRKKWRKSSTNTPFPSLKYIEGLFKSMGKRRVPNPPVPPRLRRGRAP